MDVVNRYEYKIKTFCDGVDPFTLDVKTCIDTLPRNVGYFDLVNYCIEKDSAYTLESFKAYKSLEAFKFFQDGLVQKISCRNVSDGSLILASVKHSMRTTLKDSKCWISIDKNGVVLCGHCSCMAGQGEVCSHIAAALFVLEAWARKSQEIDNSDQISCTDVLSQWLVPPTKHVNMAQIKDIKWTTKPITVNAFIDPLPAWDASTIDSMLKIMELKNATCPIMALRDPFSEKFVDKSHGNVKNLLSDDNDMNMAVLNLFLVSLFDVNNLTLSLDDLRQKAEGIALAYTQEEIDLVEAKTREQSKSLLWYRFRAGRVTASVFKRVCRTSIKTPAISLIEKICFPENHIFYSTETEYGKENEQKAREDYVREMELVHSHFIIRTSGLVINNAFPHCGVSPDGITNCDCCGKGGLEIKCPYVLRFNKLGPYLKKKNCPLVVVNGEYNLHKDHEYYYQVQMQIVLLNLNFCDFVIWYPDNFITVRVFKDENFWNQEFPKTEVFFKKVLLPELLGTYFTRNKRRN